MKEIKRVIIIVLDSVGVGELPDASLYQDEGSNTLANTASAVGGLNLPYFQQLGLGNITPILGMPPNPHPQAAYGKMREKSTGKDTTTGHWELMGLITKRPFPTYPQGFPKRIIEVFQKEIGTKILGNKPASGTEIIKELGEEHLKTGYPIVYTSADSVFQIAAHEDIITVPRLYEICRKARKILKGKNNVGRVIARPFIGEPGNFTRTPRRKDFSLQPPQKTILDYLMEKEISIITVGKISQIFGERGITHSFLTKNNEDGIDRTLNCLKNFPRGLIFTNLIDFDMLWGHRNNPQAYAQGLKEVDKRLPEIFKNLKPEDILIFTADHGCDPTTLSTDHSREYAPLLVYGKKVKSGVNLGTRESFADLGKTVANFLGIDPPVAGKSFVQEVLLNLKPS